MKIGVFGGAFDPIHLGHLRIILEIFKFLNLDKVLVVPSGNPPHKGEIELSEHRVNMINSLIEGYTKIEIEDYEINNPNSRSFTYKTLEYLKTKYRDSQLYFICGDDCLETIDSWGRAELIFKLSTIVVFRRDDKKHDKMIEIKKSLEKKYSCNIILLENSTLEVSSTLIKEKIKSGENISDFVPQAVEKYIFDNHLYGSN